MDTYNKIVQEIKKLQKPKVEKNIFSIGGRGHYENPISDILAFFIDPREEHGSGVLFLQSLFDGANIQYPLLELVRPPNRERCTDAGNRIDLIAEGDNWVLIVENKVRHRADNPFTDYTEYIARAYKGKIPYYILLSVQNETPPAGWKSVTWSRYINCIKKNVGTYLTTEGNAKWHIILREFILNIENECGGVKMGKERIEYVMQNYKAIQETIQEMNDMLNEYIEYMTDRAMDLIKSASKHEQDVASCKKENWGQNGTALRLVSRKWGGKTNITLLLRRDGSMRIQIYVHDVPDGEVESLRKHINEQKYTNYLMEQRTIRRFGFFDESDHDRVFDEILDITHRLNDYYSSKRKET